MLDTLFSDEEMGAQQEYQVLARKYRPKTFKDMIGQEVLVKTFSNAFASNRIAHAFLLTGIRGVGKTTTARIIAKALNCIGPDGNGGVTMEPCGVCMHCKSISEDRHQDVLEMDAASHTGVGDIREIIENARYRPVSARYKVYIIDEVHMLSNSAFNALLKTLEEPPAHVKFIFATTELRKIPITILSRCQRFDLKRVEVLDLQGHFKEVLNKEGFTAQDDALRLIASVSGGSVRDGLSILDQAISHNKGDLTVEAVRNMLGLADTEKLYDLFEAVILGNSSNALSIAKELYNKGADPILVVQDLLGLNHTIAKLQHCDDLSFELAELEQKRSKALAEKLSVSFLARSWQMLLKGLEEIKSTNSPFQVMEMLLIRLAFASSLPSIEELIKGGAAMPPTPATVAQSVKEIANSNASLVQPKTFKEIIDLMYEANELVVFHSLKNDVHLVSLEGENLVIKVAANAPKNFHQQLQVLLMKLTGQKWNVTLSVEGEAQPTIFQQEKQQKQQYMDEIKQHDMVQEMLNNFGDLEIAEVKKSN